MRCPTQGATGGWVMLGLYSSGFLFVGSHYLIFPRVSSLVVWTQCSHSKGSGFDFWSGTRFHKWCVMASCCFFTNIVTSEFFMLGPLCIYNGYLSPVII